MTDFKLARWLAGWLTGGNIDARASAMNACTWVSFRPGRATIGLPDDGSNAMKAEQGASLVLFSAEARLAPDKLA